MLNKYFAQLPGKNRIVFSFLLLLPIPLFGQQICMVTADYETGEDYVIMWEPIEDVTGIDSIFVYRKQGLELEFSHVGSVAVTESSSTYFIDTTANTSDTTKYSIVYIYSDLSYSPLSPWHQASVMDYAGNGDLVWTKYKKEDQTDESYIDGYEVLKDNLGIGNFLGLGSLLNSVLGLTDILYILTPQAKYVVEVSLPSCNVQEKANIHTSRSNIKQQVSNPGSSTNTDAVNPYPPVFETDPGNTTAINSLNGIEFQLSPNPAREELNLQLEKIETVDEIRILDLSGKNLIESLHPSSTNFSISTAELNNGMYLIQVESNGSVASKRFIVAH